MKTSLKFSFLLLLTAFLFGSCNSSLGFSKRRYNKGYHVSIIKDRHYIPNKNAVVLEPTAGLSHDSHLKLTAPLQVPYTEVPAAAHDEKKSFKSIPKLLPANFSKPLKYQNDQIANLFSLSRHSPSENPAGFMAKQEEGQSTIKNYNDDRSYSLLWIAVVLIVFLWYLGFLAGWGSGGIINLLLIVAFILLVLWLLRIL